MTITAHDRVKSALSYIQLALEHLQAAMLLEPYGRVGEAVETGFSKLVQGRDHLVAHLGPFYGTNELRCPVCVEQNLRSSVHSQGTTATCLGFRPYHDEDGVYHSHDPNRRTTYYLCTNDHSFQKIHYPPCPSCGEVKAPDKIIVVEGVKP